MNVEALEQYISDYETATADSREYAERDRDYYDHIQLTAEEISALEKRKQPTGIYNRVRPKINTLLGMQQQTRTDPKAYPRNPKNEQSAQVATDAIRYVCDNNNFDDTASAVFLQECIEGTGVVDVFAKQKRDDIEIKIKQIEWDRFIYDPHSRCPHFSDARYLGVTIWQDKEELLEEYPDAEEAIAANMRSQASETLDDKPSFWFDSKRQRVRTFQMYFIDKGKWNYAVFVKGAFLEEPQESPYQDEDGKPDCPLIAVSQNVDRQGNRFGEVRAYIGQQDEVNKRRNKALHLLSQRQTFSASGTATPEQIAQLKRELAKPDGHLEFTHGTFGNDFGIIPTQDMASGNLALLQDAKQEIDAQGANAALSGKMEGSASGRAVQARQQGGQLEVTPLLDRHKMWQKAVYRAIWDRVKQFWQQEKWVRVTDSEGEPIFVGMNIPVTRGEVLQQQGVPMPPEAQFDPRLSEPIGKRNNVAEIDVDIVIDQSQDVVTLQNEQFEQIAKLFQANPQGIPFDLLIEASTLRNKDKILKRLRGEDEKSQQQNQQKQQEIQQQKAIQQQAIQLNMADKQADVQKKQSEAAKNAAQVEKTMAETEQAKINAAHKYYLGN